MARRLTADQARWIERFIGLKAGARAGGERGGGPEDRGVAGSVGGAEDHAEDLMATPAWARRDGKTVPTTGSYKDIPNNKWGGLPEVLYPDTPDNFLSLQAIDYHVAEMAALQYDAHTLMNETSGERRLPHKVAWASQVAEQHSSGSSMPAIADLEADYTTRRAAVLSEVTSISKPELKAFLTETIHAVIPPFVATQTLRRSERPPGHTAGHEDRLIRLLLARGT